LALRRAHVRNRRLSDLAFVPQPLDELLERSEPLRGRRRPLTALLEADEKGLDVLATDPAGAVGMPLSRRKSSSWTIAFA
jgi:hypothetical protein